MTVRYDPRIEWAREDRQTRAIEQAREAVDRLTGPAAAAYRCRPEASCLDRTDGYLCDAHLDEEFRAANFGVMPVDYEAGLGEDGL